APQPCRPRTASRSSPRGCECPPGRVGRAPRGSAGAPCRARGGGSGGSRGAQGSSSGLGAGSSSAGCVRCAAERGSPGSAEMEQLRAASPKLQILLPGSTSALSVLRRPWQGPASRCRVRYLKSCDYANLT
ncbi:hypothetical protein Nmel_008935, partial [Mimus melanotis]